MVIAHKRVCVCHNTQNEPTYMLILNPRCKYYDHTTRGKTRMECIEMSKYPSKLLITPSQY